jgi:hypothetical protein
VHTARSWLILAPTVVCCVSACASGTHRGLLGYTQDARILGYTRASRQAAAHSRGARGGGEGEPPHAPADVPAEQWRLRRWPMLAVGAVAAPACPQTGSTITSEASQQQRAKSAATNTRISRKL